MRLSALFPKSSSLYLLYSGNAERPNREVVGNLPSWQRTISTNLARLCFAVSLRPLVVQSRGASTALWLNIYITEKQLDVWCGQIKGWLAHLCYRPHQEDLFGRDVIIRHHLGSRTLPPASLVPHREESMWREGGGELKGGRGACVVSRWLEGGLLSSGSSSSRWRPTARGCRSAWRCGGASGEGCRRQRTRGQGPRRRRSGGRC